MKHETHTERLAKIKANAETKQYTLMFGGMVALFLIGFLGKSLDKQPIATVVLLGSFTIAGILFYMMSQGVFPNKISPQASEPEESTLRPKKQITLRLDAALFDQLEHLAEEDLRSLNNQIEFMLRKSVQQQTVDSWLEEKND
jgi:hypothetical protein